jgi:endonuclease/exonuclease/phosphatase family metal-dependent hydrolase
MALLPPPELGLPAPPDESVTVLDGFAAALDELPKKKTGNLLIGTWNIRHFGRVQRAWESKPRVSPKRNLQDLCAIAQLVARFDVVALVEVKRDLTALRLLRDILGPRWAFIVSDVTEGTPGNSERLGYIFDTRRVRSSGLVGELVIPDAELEGAGAIMQRQFVRTPYTVSFQAREKGFTLVTLHVIYGTQSTPEVRTPEIARFAQWLREHAEDPDEFNRNMVALGDFNIDKLDDANWRALVVDGSLSPPAELIDLPRTLGETKDKHSFYDQIAWFNKGKGAALTLKYKTAGNFVWDQHLLQDVGQSEKEARISDHYPLWAEFLLDA